ncbi:unnamed protein product [Paramecium octaurelia]|uniref:Uncharacterized protein n=1 Tax=Paramecium octaurelia TaxID=43137 RepID=A0A8S1XU30_PAROT|nr:unnamed protein product [Paramecium octaurelia]
MKSSMKGLRGRVWSIQVRSNNQQAVSASADGSCTFGVQNHSPELCVYSKVLYLKWFFTIMKKVNCQQQEVIEKQNFDQS